MTTIPITIHPRQYNAPQPIPPETGEATYRDATALLAAYDAELASATDKDAVTRRWLARLEATPVLPETMRGLS